MIKKLAIIIRMLLIYTPRFITACAFFTCVSKLPLNSPGLTKRAPIMEVIIPVAPRRRGNIIPVVGKAMTPRTIAAARAET